MLLCEHMVFGRCSGGEGGMFAEVDTDKTLRDVAWFIIVVEYY